MNLNILHKEPYVRRFTSFLKQKYDNKKLVGAEVGVGTGVNALSMLQNLDIDRLYLVDPYLDHPKKYKQHPFDIAKKNLKKHSDKITWVKMKSEKAIPYISNGFDFVYIDGDHSYDVIRSDIELYFPLVKLGGVLGGHDFVPDYFGVVRAVCEFKEKMNLDVFGKSGDWWFVKKVSYLCNCPSCHAINKTENVVCWKCKNNLKDKVEK